MSPEFVGIPLAERWYTDAQAAETREKSGSFEDWVAMCPPATVRKVGDRDGCHGKPRPQGTRDTCLMFALVAAMETRLKCSGTKALLSPQYAYWLCNRAEGRPNPWCGPGVTTLAAAQYLAAEAICIETYCKYPPKPDCGTVKAPADRAIANAIYRIRDYIALPSATDPQPNVCTTDLLEGILADGYDVVLALGWFGGGPCPQVVDVPAGKPRPNQAHAMLLVESQRGSTPYFVFNDSFPGCVRKVTHAFVEQYALAGVVVRDVEVI